MTMTSLPRLVICATTALLTACQADATAPLENGHPLHPTLALQSAEAGSQAQQDLAELRALTAPLRQLDDGVAAGWNVQITECKEHETDGGMGHHWGRLDYYLDGLADPGMPEVLLYAPGPRGQMQLVAVEYIVPAFAWAGPGVPELFGREMDWIEDMGEWQLHVWVWRYNPSGLFAPWNPRIDCPDAS